MKNNGPNPSGKVSTSKSNTPMHKLMAMGKKPSISKKPTARP